MKTVVWLVEGTWEACVDAARALPDPVVLLHVIGPDTAEALAGARAGLLGRAVPSGGDPDPFGAAQTALLDAAQTRLGRPAARIGRRGRPEREVLAVCGTDDLLVVARDGDRSRPGPHSLAPPTRFVVDHAPCRVLLVWP